MYPSHPKNCLAHNFPHQLVSKSPYSKELGHSMNTMIGTESSSLDYNTILSNQQHATSGRDIRNNSMLLWMGDLSKEEAHLTSYDTGLPFLGEVRFHEHGSSVLRGQTSGNNNNTIDTIHDDIGIQFARREILKRLYNPLSRNINSGFEGIQDDMKIQNERTPFGNHYDEESSIFQNSPKRLKCNSSNETGSQSYANQLNRYDLEDNTNMDQEGKISKGLHGATSGNRSQRRRSSLDILASVSTQQRQQLDKNTVTMLSNDATVTMIPTSNSLSSKKLSSTNNSSYRRYSLSHGNDELDQLPGFISLQELDKIDISQNGVMMMRFNDDAKLFPSNSEMASTCLSAPKSQNGETKSIFMYYDDLLDESIQSIRDAIRAKKRELESLSKNSISHNSTEIDNNSAQITGAPFDSLLYGACRDQLHTDSLPKLQQRRRDSLFSLSHSRRGSLFSLSQSIGEGFNFDSDFNNGSNTNANGFGDKGPDDYTLSDDSIFRFGAVSEISTHQSSLPPLVSCHGDNSNTNFSESRSFKLSSKEVMRTDEAIFSNGKVVQKELHNMNVVQQQLTSTLPTMADLKRAYEAFGTAMMESQKSQQSIHEWDKLMGLKRSHSKTMRLSMKTRKRLRTILRRELTAFS